MDYRLVYTTTNAVQLEQIQDCSSCYIVVEMGCSGRGFKMIATGVWLYESGAMGWDSRF